MDYYEFLKSNNLSLSSIAKQLNISRQSFGQKVKSRNRQFLTPEEEKNILKYLTNLNINLSNFLKEKEKEIEREKESEFVLKNAF